MYFTRHYRMQLTWSRITCLMPGLLMMGFILVNSGLITQAMGQDRPYSASSTTHSRLEPIRLAPPCRGARTNFLTDTAGAASCISALPTMARKDQQAVLLDYLVHGRTYIDTERAPALARGLFPEPSRRLTATVLVAQALKRDPDITAKLERAIDQAVSAQDEISLAYLRRAEVEVARLNRDKPALEVALLQAETLAERHNLTGLQPHLQNNRGDIAARNQQYTHASRLFSQSLYGLYESGNRSDAGTVCGRFAFTASRDKTIDDAALSEKITKAETLLRPDWPCLLFAALKRAQLERDDIDAVMRLGDKALNAAERIGYSTMVPDLLNNMANTAKRAGKYTDAVDYYQQAADAYERVGIEFMVGAVSVNLGRILLDLGDTEQSIQMFTRGFDSIEQVAPDRADLILKTAVNLGTAHTKAGDYRVAARWFDRAQQTSASQPVRYFDGMINAEYAKTLYALGETENAMAMADEAVDILLNNGDRPDASEAAEALIWMATHYIDNDDMATARKTLKRAEKIMEPEGQGASFIVTAPGDLYSRLAYAQGMATVMSAMGQEAEAAPYALAALQISEARFAEDKVRAAANAELKFTLKDRERSLSLLERDAQITQLSLQKSRMQTMIGYGAALATALLALMLWRSYNVQRQLTDTQKQLVKTKDTFLSEIHHRLSNNMQLISSLLNMDARRMDEELLQSNNELKDPFNPGGSTDIANRARTMSMIHNHIYHHGKSGSVNAKIFFDELIDLLDEALGRDGIIITGTIDPLPLDVSLITPIGLIICEAVTNAFKYAFVGRDTGEIKLSLYRQEETLVLAIRDNGIGSAGDPREGSLGMELMKDLSRQIDGDFQFNAPSTGTTISIAGIKA